MSNVSFMSIIADLSVAAKQHKMPPKDSWKEPQNSGEDKAADNYKKGVGDMNWGMGFPAADGILSYFGTQSSNTYHFTSATTMTMIYKSFIHTQLEAAQYAFNMWKLTLYFDGLKINGPTAVGKSGCLVASTKDSELGCAKTFFTLYQTYPGHSPYLNTKHYADWRDAVGKGTAKCLRKYVDGVTVPGLPWYPAFAAFPGPATPPLPNVTFPLISCPSKDLKQIIVSNNLKKAILNEVSGGLKDKSNDKFVETAMGAIADSLAMGFLIWVSSQTVSLVMGQGSIPTFSPPFVPVGPVVNGANIPTMGGNLI